MLPEQAVTDDWAVILRIKLSIKPRKAEVVKVKLFKLGTQTFL